MYLHYIGFAAGVQYGFSSCRFFSIKVRIIIFASFS